MRRLMGPLLPCPLGKRETITKKPARCRCLGDEAGGVVRHGLSKLCKTCCGQRASTCKDPKVEARRVGLRTEKKGGVFGRRTGQDSG